MNWPSDAAASDPQAALAAPTVEAEEAAWTGIIRKFEKVEAPWKADVVGRAYGNRGNARSRQGNVRAPANPNPNPPSPHRCG